MTEVPPTMPEVGSRPSWRETSWYVPVAGSRRSRLMFVRDERAMSITSDRTTPMTIPAMIPKTRMPSPPP